MLRLLGLIMSFAAAASETSSLRGALLSKFASAAEGNGKPIPGEASGSEGFVYFFAGGGANCPSAQVITTVDECKTAGLTMGYPFRGIVTSDATSNGGDGRPAGCFWDQNGLSYFNTNLKSTTSWNGVGGLCLRPPEGPREYYRAKGAKNCAVDQRIGTSQECKIAGEAIGYPFRGIVTSDATSNGGDGRPAGCFWDQNGLSYFNTNLKSSTSWNGVGGLCLHASTQDSKTEN